MLNRRFLRLLCLILLLSPLLSTAGPGNFLQLYPARPYWYNPGALCYDTSNSISLFSRFEPVMRLNNFRRENAFLENWMSAEYMLPGKAGALGLQLGMTENIGMVWDTRSGSLSYAYGVGLAKGRLSFGLQADITQFRFDLNSFLWRGGPADPGQDFRTDIAAGVFYRIGNLMTGLSGRNLLASSFRISEGNDELLFQSPRILNLMLAYSFRLNDNWTLHTAATQEALFTNGRSIFIRPQINATVAFRDELLLGISYPALVNASIAFNGGLRLGNLDMFAIFPFDQNFQAPTDYRLGISYRFGKAKK